MQVLEFSGIHAITHAQAVTQSIDILPDMVKRHRRLLEPAATKPAAREENSCAPPPFECQDDVRQHGRRHGGTIGTCRMREIDRVPAAVFRYCRKRIDH
jgi:hypothetical protein